MRTMGTARVAMTSLCAFAAGGGIFASTSGADNRLNVYEVATGKLLSQLVPSGHLNKLAGCTALALSQVPGV